MHLATKFQAVSSGFGLGAMLTMTALPANNALERTVMQRGRAALAMDCVLAGAEVQRWPAAHQDR